MMRQFNKCVVFKEIFLILGEATVDEVKKTDYLVEVESNGLNHKEHKCLKLH